MAKCIRCGKSTALRGLVKLKDADLCRICFKDLGFDKRDLLTASVYRYDDIKDGRDAYYKKMIIRNELVSEATEKVRVSLVSNYGQERELNCTEGEQALFDAISAAFPDEDLRLARVSKDYVTIRRGDSDVIRIKYTNKAKWIVFNRLEAGQVKHYIQSVDEWTDYHDQIRESIENIKKYEV